ncbi:MAG: hypothetical protein JW815_06260 [Candidatus Bathyarchaeota archaeon]|nr:hypothetical protein [Candidatus Bathyarchaeum sp.]
MNNISVHVEVEVNPTEDLEKVKQAVQNILGTVAFKVESRKWGQLLIANTTGTAGLSTFRNILARERIRAAARKVLLGGMDNDSVTFYLNKQVAYANHVSFSQKTAESPLGPISVQISCSNPRELIKWLTPRPTKKPLSHSRHK